MESGEFRVKIWCVRRADTFFYSAAWGGVTPTPPQFSRYIALVVRLHGTVKTVPYK